MNRIYASCSVGALIIALQCTHALAATVYRYQGEPIADFGPPDLLIAITGTLTLDQGLPADLGPTGLVDIEEFAGFQLQLDVEARNLHVATPADEVRAAVSTDSAGAIVEWDFFVGFTESFRPATTGVGTRRQTERTSEDPGAGDFGIVRSSPVAANSGDPGEWSVVPLPGALVGLGSALATFVAVRRKRRSGARPVLAHD